MPQTTLLDAPVSLDHSRDQSSDHGSKPLLDQRQTERHQLSHPAVVTVIGALGRILHGVIRNLSEGGTQIRLDEPLPPSTLVKIEYDDNLLLGEVVYCNQEQSSWLAGVRVEHGLFELTALARAMQGF
jgi:hypothetical protein